MKKTVCLILAVLLTLASGSMAVLAEPDTIVTINVFNWGQYISDGSEDSLDVNAEFTKQTGIKVNYSNYDTNEALYKKLESGGANYDVIIPSDYMVQKLIKEDMLEKINFDNVPNFNDIDESLKNPYYDPKNEYSVPYTTGTVGIIYNKKHVTKTVDSWSILWDEEYKDKILMFDNTRDAFSIAQFLLGQDVNTTKQDDLIKASEKLKEQKPLVQQYVMDEIFDKMENEEAWISTYYAGDAVSMMAENEDLDFVLPKEGFNYFVDAICIPKSAKNKEAAEKYINFLTDAQISAENIEFLSYTTPSTKARELMSEEYSQNEIIFPTSETLERSQSFENLPDDTFAEMEKLWIEVKTSGNKNIFIYIISGATVLIVVAFLIIRAQKKKKLYED